MPIVKDQKKSLSKADEISIKITNLIKKEAIDFFGENDPAEHIYLSAHILGNLVARLAMSITGYAEIYSIQELTLENFIKWVNIISTEIINSTKGQDKCTQK